MLVIIINMGWRTRQSLPHYANKSYSYSSRKNCLCFLKSILLMEVCLRRCRKGTMCWQLISSIISHFQFSKYYFKCLTYRVSNVHKKYLKIQRAITRPLSYCSTLQQRRIHIENWNTFSETIILFKKKDFRNTECCFSLFVSDM